MKATYALRASTLAGLLLAVLVMFNPGCASAPKPDWDQRVGNYTFEDAARELGPPVSSTKLKDGSQVAEWLLSFGSQMPLGYGTAKYGPGGGVSQGVTFMPPTQNHYLRLTFGTDGKLQGWRKFDR